MPSGISWWDKIVGTWAIAAGVSLAFTFFRTYRARMRYLYLLLLGFWAVLWGVNRLRPEPLTPGWLLWVCFLAGLAAMVGDSARRYRETSERIRREREEKQRGNGESGE